MDNSGRIEDWAIVSDSFQLKAPDARGRRFLYGKVYSEHYDGLDLLTSPLLNFNFEDRLAYTTNSRYVLGEPAVEYIRQYGDRLGLYASPSI